MGKKQILTTRWPGKWWCFCVKKTSGSRRKEKISGDENAFVRLLHVFSLISLLLFSSSSFFLSFSFSFSSPRLPVRPLLLPSSLSVYIPGPTFSLSSPPAPLLHLCSLCRDEDGNRTESEIDQNSISFPWLLVSQRLLWEHTVRDPYIHTIPYQVDTRHACAGKERQKEGWCHTFPATVNYQKEDFTGNLIPTHRLFGLTSFSLSSSHSFHLPVIFLTTIPILLP